MSARLPRWRRWSRALGYVVLGLLVLLTGALGWVFYTASGTARLVRAGLSIYDGMIPGSVEVERIDGTIASGLSLSEITLRDGVGQRLVEAEVLALRLPPAALVQGTADLRVVRLEGVTVYALEDRGGNFGDLGPVGGESEPPEPPSDTVGPDLPLRILGSLQLRDVDILGGPVAFPQPRLVVSSLDLEFDAEGTRASADLSGRVAAPVSGIFVDWIELRAAWSDPGLELEGVLVQSNLGDASIEYARVDFSTLDLSIADMQAALELGELVPGADPALAPVRISLDASGDPTGLSAELDTVLRGPESVSAGLVVWGERGADEAVTFDVFGDCGGCLRGAGALNLSLAGAIGAQGRAGRAALRLEGDGLALEADVAGVASGVAGLHATLEAPELRAIEPLLDRFAPGLRLRGELGMEVACGFLPEAALGACRSQLAWDRGHPIRRARIDITAGRVVDQHVLARLHTLDVQAFGTRVVSSSDEAVAEYSPALVRASGVALDVATATGEGHVELDARIALDGGGPAQAHVDIDDLDLAALNAVVPGLNLGGRLDAALSLEGSLARPRVDLELRARDTALRGADWGDLRLAVEHRPDPGILEIDAALLAAGGQSIRASARLPVSIDLEQQRVEPRAQTSARAEIHVEALALERLARLAALGVSLRGTLAADVEFEGTLARPRLAVRLAATDIELKNEPLPEVQLDADYRGGRIEAKLEAHRPGVLERLRLRARVPVAVDLDRARVRWQPARPHEIDLRIVDARLAALSPWVPEHAPAGGLDVELFVRGDMLSPVVEGELHGRELEWDGRSVGEVDLGLAYADDAADVRLFATSPEITGLGLELRVPVTISPGRRQIRWHSEREHALDLAVTGLLVDRALRWLPPDPDRPGDPKPAVAGRLDAQLELRGPARSPRIRLDAELEGGEYGGRGLGDLWLHAELDDDGTRARSRWRASPAHEVRMQAQVPLTLDLSTGEYHWRRGDPHRVRLSAPRVDRELLEPFVDLGEVELATAVHVVADGNADHFEIGASMAGTVRAAKQGRRFVARLEVDPTRQQAWVDLGETGPDSIHISAETRAPLESLLSGGDWQAVGLRGDARLDDLDLRIVEAFLPRDVQDPSGKLAARATFGGTLGKPTIDAQVDLDEGAATIVPARQRIQGLRLKAHANNDRLVIDELRFDSGRGSVEGRGHARVVQGGVRGELSLDLDKLPVRSPGVPYMALSSRITTRLEASLERLGVEIDLAETKVDVYSSNIVAAEPIPSNENVVYGDLELTRGREGPGSPGADPSSHPSPDEGGSRFETEVEVALSDPVAIVGPAIDMEWDGKVFARSGKMGTRTSGALRAKDGYFELLGNQFDIERGTVTLADDGSNRLFIDLIAGTEVDGVEITATVRGELPKPELEFSSSPALTQSEIFTVLVTGSADVQSADAEEVQAKAASVLAAVSNPALERQLNDTLRVDRIRVGFGEATDQPILAVGKNLSKKLYAETEYHHNAPQNQNTAELRVEYDVAPRWTLETFFGDAAAGGIDLFWGRAFDTDRNVRRKRRRGAHECTPPGDKPPQGKSPVGESDACKERGRR